MNNFYVEILLQFPKNSQIKVKVYNNDDIHYCDPTINEKKITETLPKDVTDVKICAQTADRRTRMSNKPKVIPFLIYSLITKSTH